MRLKLFGISVLIISSILVNVYAQTDEEVQYIDIPETNIQFYTNPPPAAPTNRANVDLFLDNYKKAIEQKDVDKYLSCFSKLFKKEMMEINQGYTNRYFLTYNDIEAGVKEDRFSQYQGKDVKVSYVIKSVAFNYIEAEVKLELTVQAGGTNKRNEVFTLLWNEEKQKWELASF